MKIMADSLSDLGCTVTGRNLILNVLWGLNKQYNHLWAIIMCNTPFPTFHKVQDDLVLEELTLGSNNTPAPPTPALSCPLATATRVKSMRL
jgi:hypothetical protein